ncbi:hypothetical protein [Streptomyces sp. NPDC059071]|uniref:hypothetical protein n=1 Tax=unclassified Streptomyces TaxID=2593676 RepID=UPI003669F3FF
MHPSFRIVLVPQCTTCRTTVLDDDGRELLVAERFLSEELRQRLTAAGWVIVLGDRRANRGPHDSIGGDRLSCPDCVARREEELAAYERRLSADHARPRVKTVDMSARLGPGWTLTQRAGDAERHYWLVERDGTVHGAVNRYHRSDGTFSSGWEAHTFSAGHEWRLEAIGSCQKLRNSSFLWSARDLAAWGIAHRPAYGAARPPWAARATSTSS